MNQYHLVNEKKSILMLHGGTDMYGSGKIFLITASLLQKNNHNVHVVLSEESSLSKELRLAGVAVSIVRLGILRKKYFSIPGLLNRIGVLASARKKLIEIVKKERIDIVYSNTAVVLVGGFVARNCGVKHVWHIHEITKNALVFNVVGRLFNWNTDKVIAVSNEVKKHWSKKTKGDKIVTIYNGLDYDIFLNATTSLKEELGIKDNQVTVGMIGRVNAWKGHRYFVEIAALLSKKYPNVRFVMVGDAYPGEEYLQDELKDAVRKSGLEDAVHYLGFRSDVPHVLKGLDIFVLPSILPDPLPTVVLEAMACGRPVVATQHGGALEMVDDQITGILIPWDNPHIAAERFEILISDAIMRKEMGEAGRERVLELFSKNRYEANILNAVQSV
jgi:glycosyltransferase involved in cell wall biosynthesis